MRSVCGGKLMESQFERWLFYGWSKKSVQKFVAETCNKSNERECMYVIENLRVDPTGPTHEL